MPEVTTVDPATGQVLATYPAADVDAVRAVLARVHAAQPGWAACPVAERAELVRAVGARLREVGGDHRDLLSEGRAGERGGSDGSGREQDAADGGRLQHDALQAMRSIVSVALAGTIGDDPAAG